MALGSHEYHEKLITKPSVDALDGFKIHHRQHLLAPTSLCSDKMLVGTGAQREGNDIEK